MAQQVTSVCVVTTNFEGKRYGLTATAFASVCVEPPRLLVCVSKTGSSHNVIVKAGNFCVNLLGGAQGEIAKAFAGLLGKNLDKFAHGRWYEAATGAPILRGAAATFECTLVQTIDQFSHSIFIGEVVGVSHNAQDPLLYGAHQFRTLSDDSSVAVAKVAGTLDI